MLINILMGINAMYIPYAPSMEYAHQHLPEQNHPNVGKYTSTMEHMGYVNT